MSIQFVKSTKDFDDYVKANKYLVANFTASWCGPCQSIKPIIDQLYTDTNARYEHIEIVRVDLDSQQELAAKFQISSVPSFVFLESGAEVKRVTGANVPELISSLDELNKKARDDPQAGRAGNGATAEKLSESSVYKDIDQYIPKGFEALNGTIDFGGFEALNVVPLFKAESDADVKNAFRLDYKKEQSTVVSDADSQVLFYVPLLNISKVYSILLKFRPGKDIAKESDADAELELDADELNDETQPPKLIKLWVNKNSILSFDDAASDSSAPHIEKIAIDGESVWYECKLKFVRFQNVQSLNIFIDGDDEDSHTTLDKIILVGVNGETKDQGKLSKDE
ncbi:hypothetical protein G9P44_005518 [Scheffersomyces stipitis]|nr:hypothetical protein G9P44_005518 [Scheffersomyces stipitis]